MKLAVISDVHANRQALDAVLADATDAERVVCLGDVVGYGGSPAECVKRVREACDVAVSGNHDRFVVDAGTYANPTVAASHRHARHCLGNDAFRWLGALPRRRDLDGKLLVHSHPTRLEEHVPPERASEIASATDASVVLYGHTHLPCERRVGGTLVVNPGSVGQPRDGDPRASYAVIDDGHVDIRRVEYDVAEARRAIREAGIPTDAARRLSRGE